MSDKENPKEDEYVRNANDEADVEGHKLMSKNVAKSDEGEDGGTPDVEAHRNVHKNMPKTEDGEDGDAPDVEAHRLMTKTVPRNTV